uniref:T9SS type A sorting domain-containing protein n=1 Tax=candidate division WOR-3 bacterium TaxID=2052148 RepID=A0A7V3ZXK3_UNCW3
MLSIILSVLLAGIPKYPALLDNSRWDGEPGKINETTPGAIELSTGYPGGTSGSWRVSVLQGEGHNNIAVINDTIVAVAFAKFSGDATYYMQGLSIYYSFDGGLTFEGQYDVDVTPTVRTYPETYFDRETGNLWVVTQIYPATGTADRKILVVKDENVPEFGGGLFTTYYFNVNAFGPSIVAKGDKVVWVASDNDTGYFIGYKSEDGGTNWTQFVVPIEQVTYQPDLYMLDDTVLVICAISFDGSSMIWPYFWVSYDFGETWNGPDSIIPYAYQEYGFESWWYDASTVLWNGKIHWFGAYGEPGYEGGGVLAHFIYDPYERTIEERTVFNSAFYNNESGAWESGIPYGVTPQACKSMDEKYLIVFFLNLFVVDTTTTEWGWAYVYSEDGITWSDIIDAGAPYGDYNSRSEIAPHIPVTESATDLTLKWYFLGGYNGNNYVNLLWYPGQSTVSVRENEAYAFAFGVRPTIVTGNMSIEFALPKTANVDVTVYNVSGQKVRTLYSGTLNAGNHRMSFDSSFGKGIYFVTVTVDGKSTSRKIVVK